MMPFINMNWLLMLLWQRVCWGKVVFGWRLETCSCFRWKVVVLRRLVALFIGWLRRRKIVLGWW